ncbi:UNVERIFIED_CONTAM: hypothetical protein HHA_249325 [Hammondia hammondi]|eukprot:XP_008883936.1 hypothetical protein HHA_249325 [Hammondia hammondi]
MQSNTSVATHPLAPRLPPQAPLPCDPPETLLDSWKKREKKRQKEKKKRQEEKKKKKRHEKKSRGKRGSFDKRRDVGCSGLYSWSTKRRMKREKRGQRVSRLQLEREKKETQRDLLESLDEGRRTGGPEETKRLGWTPSKAAGEGQEKEAKRRRKMAGKMRLAKSLLQDPWCAEQSEQEKVRCRNRGGKKRRELEARAQLYVHPASKGEQRETFGGDWRNGREERRRGRREKLLPAIVHAPSTLQSVREKTAGAKIDIWRCMWCGCRR